VNREEIIRMAREAGDYLVDKRGREDFIFDCYGIERFAASVAAAEREKVAQWMIQRSYATGHGDTTEDLLAELEWQIAENWNRAMINGVETEREACAEMCEVKFDFCGDELLVADAIRARGK
jgi:hypothetical protein